jgi:SAM-dependent methyltransferase
VNAVYDGIGTEYSTHRVPDARWERQIADAIGDARTVVNVGAGTGSYEPRRAGTVALEPSSVMISQRPIGAAPVVQGRAESLPFSDDAFDVALAILTVHHWHDAGAGLAELGRVSIRQVVVTWDPERYRRFWLPRDYLPEIYEREARLATLGTIVAELRDPRVTTLPVPADCTDGFGGAYWRRPEAYLDPRVRSAISGIALLDREVVDAAVARLRDDLASGRWHDRNADLASLDSLDLGYRLVVAGAG